ncbi:MAG: cytochrome P450 [Acidimicrobiales bacterium]|nr:cytochrome P450 [Acidimicrobiales bacterium]
MTARPIAEIDLALASLPGAELHTLLRHARQQGPVVPTQFYGSPALLITTYDVLREYFGAQEAFPGGVFYEFATRPHIGNTFINMDGPLHDTYRQIAMPMFRSRATARFIDTELTPLAHEVIDRFVDRGDADLATEFAQVLPFWSISRKLGLPFGSEEKQRAWALDLLNYPADPEGALRAADEITAFLAPVVEERRAEPRDDVISRLLTSEHAGVRFADEDVYSHVRLLYAVGATTTSDGLSTSLHRLLSEPALVQRCRREPAMLAAVVHESLRCEPPVAVLPRIAPFAGRLGGVDIPAGSPVLCGIASANRDPAVFAHADRFDPDRVETEILSFGFGSKFCPGMHMARQQILAALEVLLERLPRIRPEALGEPTGAVLRRCEHLAVSW